MKVISVVPNEFKDPRFAVTNQVIDRLTAGGTEIYISDELRGSFGNKLGVKFVPQEQLFHTELILTLGGDGTILKIASAAAEHEVPILGLNLGRVGFLAEIEWTQFELLPKILSGNYEVAERMMLELKVNGKTIGSALNDICITADRPINLIDFTVSADGRTVSHYRADGVILSTPTGSTAYSLSAGGPVIDPRLDCICFTPICPLLPSKNRTIVFSDKTVLEFAGVHSRESGTVATLDGSVTVKIDSADTVSVGRSPNPVRLVNMNNQKFYDILFTKNREGKADI